jgi:dihydroneopterin aldolase
MPDRIDLDDLTLDAIVGIGEGEQRTPQPLRISIALEVALDAAAGGDLGASVDYAAVRDRAAFVAAHGRWRLIESLAVAVARLVLAPPPPGVRSGDVQRVTVRVSKPAVLGDAVPSVRVERAAESCDLQTRMVPPRTWIDTLAATPQGGAWRALVEPDTTWSVPPDAALLVISGRPEADGRPLAHGTRIARGELAAIRAAGGVPTALLVVGKLT